MLSLCHENAEQVMTCTGVLCPPPGVELLMIDAPVMQAAPLSFLAQYTFNISLALTNITSNTILYSTSSLFTFGLSVLLLKEHITARKLLCILACIAGTALVTLSDVEGSSAAPSHDSAATGASSQGQGSSSVKASGTGLITFPGAPILGDVMVLLSSKSAKSLTCNGPNTAQFKAARMPRFLSRGVPDSSGS
jgi:drug/metabolite transporter (DMT)-like permease